MFAYARSTNEGPASLYLAVSRIMQAQHVYILSETRHHKRGQTYAFAQPHA